MIKELTGLLRVSE